MTGIVLFFLWKGRGKISICLGQFDGVGEVEASVKRDEEVQTDSKWRNSFKKMGCAAVMKKEIGVATE